MARDVIWDLRDKLLNGDTVVVEHQAILDRLVELVQRLDHHNGVAITGKDPWLVKLVK